jgi:hypothetical protein
MLNVVGLRCLLPGILVVAQCAKADTIVSTLNVWNGANSICCFAAGDGAGTTSAWSSVPWLCPTDFGDASADNDLAFSATFSSVPVPEPASIGKVLLSITILGLIHGAEETKL